MKFQRRALLQSDIDAQHEHDDLPDGYVEQRDGLGDWPSLDEEEAEAERAEQRQRDTPLPSCQM